jgi:hypothetical protein
MSGQTAMDEAELHFSAKEFYEVNVVGGGSSSEDPFLQILLSEN